MSVEQFIDQVVAVLRGPSGWVIAAAAVAVAVVAMRGNPPR